MKASIYIGVITVSVVATCGFALLNQHFNALWMLCCTLSFVIVAVLDN